MEYKLYKGIVDNKIYNEFNYIKNSDLFHHFDIKGCEIDVFLSVAYFLCPDFVEIKGYVFVADLLDKVGGFDTTEQERFEKVEDLERIYNYDKKYIEQFVNSWSVSDFLLHNYTELMNNDKIFYEYGKAIQCFWQRRAKELFPDRNIVVELGEEIMGEQGLAITMYEKWALRKILCKLVSFRNENL